MNRYEELDQDILSLGTPGEEPGITLADATIFIHAMRKLAAGEPAPDADFVEHQIEMATGEEPTPAEAAAHTQAGVPDETGHLEGEFAVPLEQVVMTIAQIVSNAMRQHSAYAYYGEMMRDLGRGELAELFDAQGKDEIEEMKYFLRRMSVLHPGGVPIPVAPTPEPSPDVQTALRYLIAGEQQAIVLFKTLHSMLGDNPMKYTIEQIMGDAQEHLDKLWQYMPATKAPEQAQANAAKVASVISKIKKAAPNQPTPQPGDVPVGAPGTEPLSAVLSREAMLQSAQLMAENQDLRKRLDQVSQQALQSQQVIESLGAENENLQVQAQAAADQAHMATEQAQLSAEQAAQQADAKMRLSIRIQQVRQQLADLVSQDPVQEEGVGFGEQAGPGTVMTSSQQGQLAQQAAMMDPTGGTGAAPTDEAAEEQQEAVNAQYEAAQQTAQAQKKTQEAAKGGSSSKKPGGGTQVTVKTSGLLDKSRKVVREAVEGAASKTRGHVGEALKEHATEIGDAFGKAVAPHGESLGQAMGRGMSQHFTEAGHKMVEGAADAGKKLLKSRKVQAGLGLVGAAYVGGKAYRFKKERDRDRDRKKLIEAVQRIAK